jgi:hypothetical protein
MKSIILICFIFCVLDCRAQQTQDTLAMKTVIEFLKWHKSGATFKDSNHYFIPKYNGKGINKTYFDPKGLNRLYNHFRSSGYVSEVYINQLKDYFLFYGRTIGSKPKSGDIIKIDGLDGDIILGTFEPEVILDNVENSNISKSLIIYNKALLSVSFAPNVELVFTLSKLGNKWLIDYIGPDNTKTDSFFRM